MKTLYRVFFLGLGIAAHSLWGTDFTWIRDSPSMEDWSFPGNWDVGINFPNNQGDSATFNTMPLTQNAQVLVDGQFTVGAINFSGPTFFYEVSSGVAQYLILDGPGEAATITIENGTTDHTLSSDLQVPNALTVNQNSSSLFTMSGNISQSGNVTFTGTGDGTIFLSGMNTYTGATTIDGVKLQIGSVGALSSNSVVTLQNADTILDLQGFSNAVQSIAADPGSTTIIGTGAMLEIANAAGEQYLGNITGEGSLALAGGTWNLESVAAYTGTTIIVFGTTMQLVGNGDIEASSGLLANGTFDISGISADSTMIAGLEGNTGIVNLGGKELIVEVNVAGPQSFSGMLTGQGQGGTSLRVQSGVPTSELQLNGTSNYFGDTIIDDGAILSSSGATALSSDSTYQVNGTLNVGSSTEIKGLRGDGSVALGMGITLTLVASNDETFSGVISGDASVVTNGTQTFTTGQLYTGQTTVASGTLLLSGSGELFPAAPVEVNGTFDIVNHSLSGFDIGPLTGTGVIRLGDNTLGVGNSSSADFTFSGSIVDGPDNLSGSIEYLGDGVWTLTREEGAANTYSGNTLISNDGTLRAGERDIFSPNSGFAISPTATLDLNGFDNTIRSFISTSASSAVTLGSGTLTLVDGGGFNGVISGTGGVTIQDGGMLFVSGANSYSGPTTVNGGTLQAGAVNTLSAASAIILQNDATLDLQTFSNAIESLTGPSSARVMVNDPGILSVTASGGVTYAGVIEGSGGVALASGSGLWNVSGSNTYTGATTVATGATLRLLDGGDISSSSSLSMAGTLDISGISNSTTINNLSGSGSIVLGEKGLTIALTSDQSFSGTIQGTGTSDPSLTIQKGDATGNTYTLSLSGVSNYLGSTLISQDTVLNATSSTALAAGSVHTVAGGLIVTDPSGNSIKGLEGDGTVTLSGASSMLGLVNPEGETFAGVISGAGRLELDMGTQTLTGQNTYTGGTSIAGGTLTLGSGGGLASTGAVDVLGTFDISNSSLLMITIGQLTGSGTVLIGNNLFQVGSGQTADFSFSGSITDGATSGSVAYLGGGTWTLLAPTTGSGNTYTGQTAVTGDGVSGTLQAGAANVFASESEFVIAATATLDLNGFDNTIQTLSGAGSVTLGAGTLTLTNGGTYSGVISETGGLDIEGGMLTVSGVNSYSGTTTVNSGTLQAGVANAFSSTSAIVLQNSAILDLQTFSNEIPSLAGDGDTKVSLDDPATLSVTAAAGETYAGAIDGTGSVALNAGTWNLSGTNTYSGMTAIASGATLFLQDEGDIQFSTNVSVAGTFDISGISGPTTINNLNGTGAVVLGDVDLTVELTADQVFSGDLQGGTGGFTVDGDNMFSLGGTSTYSGNTTIAGSATLQTTTTTALSPSSAYTVNGMLDLNDLSNTIRSLFGEGTVQTTGAGAGGVLTITNGGMFNGNITGSGASGGINLTGGTLTLRGNSDYGGTTTIANLAVLLAGVDNAFSPNSDVVALGTLNLGDHFNAINSLSGDGAVETGNSNDGILTISNGGNFTGAFSGNGALTLTGGTLTLTPDAPATVSYTGPTTLSNDATLSAGVENAFAPLSAVTLNNMSTLDLNGYNQVIASLAANAVDAAGTMVQLGGAGPGAILTINGGSETTFAGTITDASGAPCGGLTVTGSDTDLKLLNSSNSYCGPTLVTSSGTLQVANGALSGLTDVTVESAGTLAILQDNNANSLLNSDGGIVNIALAPDLSTSGTDAQLSLTTTYYQQVTSAVLNLGFANNGNPGFGRLTATGDIAIDGGLNIYAQTYMATGTYPLLATTGGTVSGTFSSIGFESFAMGDNPNISYSLSAVTLFFATANSTWISNVDGDWGNGDNWNPNVAPGLNEDDNLDVANFEDVAAAAITVTLGQGTDPDQPVSPTLLQLNLNAPTTSFTIQQLSSSSQLEFFSPDPGLTPQLRVVQGNHVINAPVVLKSDTELVLTDGAMLTLEALTSVTSDATEKMTILQNGGSGTGLLVNATTISPYAIEMFSGTVENRNIITPINGLTIGSSGITATVLNDLPGGIIGPTGFSGSLVLGGTGTTVVSNTGDGALFGPSGSDGNVIIGSTGTTIVNNGEKSSFGPRGDGGDLTIQGANTAITNSGLMGPTGAGGSTTISGGVIANSDGGRVYAGPKGTLTISGGSVSNDLTSRLGTSGEDLVFSGGTINTTGDVFAFGYTQQPGTTLQLNLTALPSVIGNVAASGKAMINGGELIVNALPGLVGEPNVVVDLVVGNKGVMGTYPTVNFTNFPPNVIPTLNYTPTAVQLFLAETVTPTPIGSIPFVGIGSVIDISARVNRNQFFMHRRLFREKRYEEEKEKTAFLGGDELLASRDAFAQLAASQTERKQDQLARVIDEERQSILPPTRVYFGPTGSFGEFKTATGLQLGFDYDAYGFFTGIDHVFDHWGVGGAIDYRATTADVKRDAGNFRIHQVHGTLYGVWISPNLPGLAFDGLVGFGYDSYKICRKAGPSTASVEAKGRPDGVETDLLLGVEYIFSHRRFFSVPKYLTATPFFNTQFIWVKVDDFEESGAGIYDLKAEEQHIRSLRSSFGLRLDYFVRTENVIFQPELSLAWQYEYLNLDHTVRFTTINSPQVKEVSVGILSPGRHTLLLGLDFLITAFKSFEAEISYDFQWNSYYKDHSLYIGVGGYF
ncbi:MAG: autotransporter-associated beta strand repeat-containing protein [Chlamydiota bacterium]